MVVSGFVLGGALYASVTSGLSQDFWRKEAGADGAGSSCPLVQRVRATLGEGQCASCSPGGRTWRVRLEEPVAEANKADGAS